MTTTDYEWGLFETIAALIREQQAATMPNRRGSERHVYDCVTLLAPFDGVNPPELDELGKVLCHDLSRSGFSFCTDDKPRTGQVIVAFGRVPPKFFVAEILHVQPTATKKGHAFQIGCRFLRRLDDARSAAAPATTQGTTGG